MTSTQQAAGATVPRREPVAADACHVLTFQTGGESFALEIRAIKEIIQYRTPTPVPAMPAAVAGVINLRGAVVPVVDLQARLVRTAATVGRRSCIVVVETEHGGEPQTVGIVVDAVCEVLEIPAAEIEPPPNFGTRVAPEFIVGMAKVRGRFVVLLDVGRVLALDATPVVTALAA